MRRASRVAALLSLALPAALALAAPVPRVPVPHFFGPIAAPPLDPPLRLTGTFGEYREGHFHAGVDFSTGEVVGKRVYAALPGAIIRLRASGAGYGRSIYLKADDGRLLVYGHLDSFDEPLASYVDSAQRATATYEQDLWPDTTRFRVRAGQRLGWSGRSGTGPPHLHFEIRRGDEAYNPLLAGVVVDDTVPPRIRAVVGQELPQKRLTASRVTVAAVDVRANGRPTMAPWRIRAATRYGTTTCEFDSVSWASGMSEVDHVYDLGRQFDDSLSHYAVRMWPPDQNVTRVVTGTHELDPGDTLTVEVTDAAGNDVVQRFTAADVPQMSRDVVATRRMEAAVGAGPEPGGHDPTAAETRDWSLDLLPAQGAQSKPAWRPLAWSVPAYAAFEAQRVWMQRRGAPATRGELHSASMCIEVGPPTLILRAPAQVAFELPPHAATAQLGLYRNSGDGWDYVGAELDSSRTRIVGGSRQVGAFALFLDTQPPRIAVAAVPRTVVTSPYPKWALEAVLTEDGSGVDRAKTTWIVDGKSVPSEWDGMVSTLRWKPWRAPERGRHSYEIVATDHAGNVARKRGTFVIG